MNIEDLYTREAHEKGTEIQINHPVTGKPMECYISLLGPDSRQWRLSSRDGLRKAAELRRKGGEIDILAFEIDQLVSVTTGWRGFKTKEGKDLEFSKEACKKLYENSPRIFDQLDLAVTDYKNFTKG